jgi:hypothetical protein
VRVVRREPESFRARSEPPPALVERVPGWAEQVPARRERVALVRAWPAPARVVPAEQPERVMAAQAPRVPAWPVLPARLEARVLAGPAQAKAVVVPSVPQAAAVQRCSQPELLEPPAHQGLAIQVRLAGPVREPGLPAPQVESARRAAAAAQAWLAQARAQPVESAQPVRKAPLAAQGLRAQWVQREPPDQEPVPRAGLEQGPGHRGPAGPLG